MKQLGCTFWFAGSILFYLAVPSLSQAKPIAADTTLSPHNSKVTRQGNQFEITGGVKAQRNLFHSFRQFSVPEGMKAYFNNADSIQNIITRVTGRSVSRLDGIIQANGNANLFLLNPNGVILGAGAKLNVGGSFLASTAESLVFNTGTFSAINPQASPLLIIDTPIGLQYGANPKGIDNASSIEVQPGKTLALVGGKVQFRGGQMLAPGGRVELGGLAESGTVGLQVEGSLGLSFPEQVARADVLLSEETTVDVRSSSGGDIAVAARNLEVSDSQLLAGIKEGLGTDNSQAGEITIQAVGAVTVKESEISNTIGSKKDSLAIGNGGNIKLEAETLLVNDSEVQAIAFGIGNPGSLFVQADDFVSFNGVTVVGSNVEEGAVGNAGNIEIQARSLSLRNGAQLQALTKGKGNAGNITIDVDNTVEIAGAGEDSEGEPILSAIFSTVEPKGEGHSGNIDIDTDSLSLIDGGQLQTVTAGKGNAGNITITADNTVEIAGAVVTSAGETLPSAIISAVDFDAQGDGGNINIHTNSLTISEIGIIGANTLGRGKAGKITVIADNASLSGSSLSQITSFVGPGAVGDGGEIEIQTRYLSLFDGASITNFVFGKAQIPGEDSPRPPGQGNAGDIVIRASDSVNISGVDIVETLSGTEESPSGLYAFTAPDTKGRAGDITVNTGAFRIGDRAVVDSQTSNADSGGNIEINATTFEAVEGEITVSSSVSGEAGELKVTAPSIFLEQGKLRAETVSQGGNIVLQDVDSLVLQRNSEISAAASDEGDGGNITIDSNTIVALNKSSITASAQAGQGGNIDVEVQGLFRSSDSIITASSELGIDGMVRVNRVEIDPSQSLVELPVEVINVEEIVAQGCGVDNNFANSKFVIAGQGGLPPNPSETIANDTILVDLGNLSSDEAVRNSDRPQSQAALATAKPAQTEIIEAQGWIVNGDGKVILTAQAMNNNFFSSGLQPPNCRDSISTSSPSTMATSADRTAR